MARESSTNNLLALAELFREQPKEGWRGSGVDFLRSQEVEGGGFCWDMECHLGADESGNFSARVLLLDRDSRRKPGWFLERGREIFSYMAGIERRMNELGYEGGFYPDPMAGNFTGHFKKILGTIRELKLERDLLSALDLSEKRATRRKGGNEK